MQNDLGQKLVVVVNIDKMRLFAAQGIKITKGIETIMIHGDSNHTQDKNQGYVHKKSTPGGFLDPHNDSKDLQHKQSANNAVKHITKVFLNNKEFKDVIIVSEPKMLGYLRQNLDPKIRQAVSKEINKDMINHGSDSIAKAVFT